MKRLIILVVTVVLCTAATVYATEESDIRSIAIGADRDYIQSQIGQPHSSDERGCKEVYKIDESREAVLIYNGEVLKSGYIVIN